MSATLNPYLGFSGNAREAMEFYQSVFGGELDVSTFGEYGGSDNPDGVMHSRLATEKGFTLMAADMVDPNHPEIGNGTVSLTGDDEVLHDYWAKLIEGGEVSVPLEKQMWGDEFGQCIDRFGVPWMVNIAAAPE